MASMPLYFNPALSLGKPPLGFMFAACLVMCSQSEAFVATITTGPRALYLQVGTGTVAGGTFRGGGIPADNAAINRVFVDVPAANLGGGIQNMLTDSTVTNSPYDNFVFCAVPAQVYVGGYHRGPGGVGSALLQVTSPTNLVSTLGDTIPFNTISWVSGGINDGTPTIPNGRFAPGPPQSLLTVARNTWFESCLAFRYDNAALFPAGVFTGLVSYTLSAP